MPLLSPHAAEFSRPNSHGTAPPTLAPLIRPPLTLSFTLTCPEIEIEGKNRSNYWPHRAATSKSITCRIWRESTADRPQPMRFLPCTSSVGVAVKRDAQRGAALRWSDRCRAACARIIRFPKPNQNNKPITPQSRRRRSPKSN